MSFAPGEAHQFDWSHETITLQGLPLTVKAAHMKLSHSRVPFVRVYLRATQELVFDAHDKRSGSTTGSAGAASTTIPDKCLAFVGVRTAVEAIFVGKARRYKGRFVQMRSHHLIEPVARTPASGWEKGQVENQVDNPRGPTIPAQASGEEPGRAECMVGRSMRRPRQTNPASRVQGPNDLGGVRG
jgi:hypothetical protein